MRICRFSTGEEPRFGVVTGEVDEFGQPAEDSVVVALAGDPRISVDQPSMVDIPAATVGMGLPPHRLADVAAQWHSVGVREEWIAKEVPRHDVQIAAFRMGRFPVTNARTYGRHCR